MDGEHWKEQMELRDPALVILQYGTNESEAGMADRDVYEKTLRALVEKLKTAVAGRASILIVAPLDRAEKSSSGDLRTKPVIKKLVDAQKKVANEAGIAFWNTYDAMGGEGSMATWVKRGLAGSDLTHPSPAGAWRSSAICCSKRSRAVFEEAWSAGGGKPARTTNYDSDEIHATIAAWTHRRFRRSSTSFN